MIVCTGLLPMVAHFKMRNKVGFVSRVLKYFSFQGFPRTIFVGRGLARMK
jgi:hypothetical protein